MCLIIEKNIFVKSWKENTYSKICYVAFTLLPELFKGPTFTQPFERDFWDTLCLH